MFEINKHGVFKSPYEHLIDEGESEENNAPYKEFIGSDIVAGDAFVNDQEPNSTFVEGALGLIHKASEGQDFRVLMQGDDGAMRHANRVRLLPGRGRKEKPVIVLSQAAIPGDAVITAESRQGLAGVARSKKYGKSQWAHQRWNINEFGGFAGWEVDNEESRKPMPTVPIRLFYQAVDRSLARFEEPMRLAKESGFLCDDKKLSLTFKSDKREVKYSIDLRGLDKESFRYLSEIQFFNHWPLVSDWRDDTFIHPLKKKKTKRKATKKLRIAA